MTSLALTPAAHAALAARPVELLDTWLGTKAAGTQRLYRHALREFGHWALGDACASDAAALELLLTGGHANAQRLAHGWAAHLTARNLAPRTTTRLLSSLSSLVRMARVAGLVPWALEGLPRSNEPRHDRSGPRRSAVERIVEHLEETAQQGGPDAARARRDLAIVRLLHGAGLRRAEVSGLDVGGVERDDSGAVVAVRVRRKGGREPQRVTIGQRAAAALGDWLQVLGAGAGQPAFPRLDRGAALAGGGRLSGEAIRLLVAARAREAGVRGPVRPHGLRHRGATDAARGGLDELVAWGGWMSVKSALPYLDDSAEARERAMRRAEV